MKKTIIICDRCKRENIGKVTVFNPNECSYAVAIENNKKYFDICLKCASEVMWLNYYHRPNIEQQIKYNINTS